MDSNKVVCQRKSCWDVCQKIISLRSNRHNVEPAYQFLVEQKVNLPKELYGSLLREMLQYSIECVPKALILKAFDGVAREDVMFDDEIATIRKWDDNIRIYRGASISEKDPRTSWSLRKDVADEYSKGCILTTVIPKEDVLLYFAHDADEEEVVINVRPGEFEILKD